MAGILNHLDLVQPRLSPHCKFALVRLRERKKGRERFVSLHNNTFQVNKFIHVPASVVKSMLKVPSHLKFKVGQREAMGDQIYEYRI